MVCRSGVNSYANQFIGANPPSESCARSATFGSRPSESLATHVVLQSI